MSEFIKLATKFDWVTLSHDKGNPNGYTCCAWMNGQDSAMIEFFHGITPELAIRACYMGLIGGYREC